MHNNITNVALFSSAADLDAMRRQAAAMLHLCVTRGWTPTVACRTVVAVVDVLAAGDVRIVVAVAPTSALVSAVTAGGGTLEVVRHSPTSTNVPPPELAAALGELVRAGRLRPEDAASLLHVSSPGVADIGDIHRRPRRTA